MSYTELKTYRKFQILFDGGSGRLKVYYSGWDGYKEHVFDGSFRDRATAIEVAERWINEYKR